MANLIITIISIALVAVAAIMGAYYGGAAYMEGQTKSYATTVIKQAEQVKAAYLLYLTQGGAPISGNIDNSSVLVTQNYLTPNPFMPDHIGEGIGFLGQPVPMWYAATVDPINTTTALRIFMKIRTQAICEQIVKQITGTTEMGAFDPADLTWSTSVDSHGLGLLPRLRKYGADCYYEDNNSNSTHDTGEDFYVFQVFVKQ